MKLTKEQLSNIKRWVDALRSGEYTQGRGRLRYVVGWSGVPRYCCLGVGLDVLAPKQWEGNTWQNPDTPMLAHTYGWTGRPFLDGPGTPYTSFGLTEDHTNDLMNLNDLEGCNFNEIADYIEFEICKDYDLNTLSRKE